MHKKFKALTIIATVLGLFLFLGGNETYFSRSGGTGLVIFGIVAPIFAILTHVLKPSAKKQHQMVNANPDIGQTATSQEADMTMVAEEPIAPKTNKGDNLIISGIVMIVIGIFFGVYSASGDLSLSEGLGSTMFGYLFGFIGIVTLIVGTVRT